MPLIYFLSLIISLVGSALIGDQHQRQPGAAPNKQFQDMLAGFEKQMARQKVLQRYVDAEVEWSKRREELLAAQDRDREEGRRAAAEPDPTARKKLQDELNRKRKADAPQRLEIEKDVEPLRKAADEAGREWSKVRRAAGKPNGEAEGRRREAQASCDRAATRVKELESQLAAAAQNPAKTDTEQAVLKAQLDEARRHETDCVTRRDALLGSKPGP